MAKRRVKTEREIEATKDVIRGLDPEQDEIAIRVLFEKKGIDLEGILEEMCDECCHWPKVCGSKESLDGHCAKCKLQVLWRTVFFGKAV